MTPPRDRSLLQNVVSLFGVHAVTYLLPLLTTPFLARVLGPEALGALVFTQAFAGTLGLVVQYGFDLSAGREVARHREDPERLARLLADVNGAKLLLGLLAVAVVAAAQSFVPLLRNDPVLTWTSVLWALAVASNLMWYFLGLERVKFVSALDIVTKTLATLGVFVFVRGPQDAWWVPALGALAAAASSAAALAVAYRDVRPRLPSLAGAANALRMGWGIFVAWGAGSVSATGGVFLLGLLLEPRLLGYYNGAERIARALQGLLTPVSRALYPRFSRAAARDPREASALLANGFRLLSGLGLALSLGGTFAAPLLVNVLLGPEFEAAIPILRALAWLPFVISINMVLGLFWLVPMGLDRAYNGTVVGGAAVTVALILALVPPYGLPGMAGAVLASELLVGAALWWWYRRTLRRVSARARLEGAEA